MTHCLKSLVAVAVPGKLQIFFLPHFLSVVQKNDLGGGRRSAQMRKQSLKH